LKDENSNTKTMSLTVKETSGPQVPVGTHIAVCFGLVDIGTQPDTGFGETMKLVIMWELPHERMVFDGIEKPMAISRFYGHSLSKKANLRKDLVGWRGREFTPEELKGFDLKNILGKPCQVSVVLNESGKSVVDAVVALPKGLQVPPPFNPLVEYSVDQGRNATYGKLPEWLRKCCDQALENDPERQAEIEAAKPGADTTSQESEDIPF
jgi:hypothetical protein